MIKILILLPSPQRVSVGIRQDHRENCEFAGRSSVKFAGCYEVKPAGRGSLKPAGRSSIKSAGCSSVKPAGCGSLKPSGRSKVKFAGRRCLKPAGRGSLQPQCLLPCRLQPQSSLQAPDQSPAFRRYDTTFIIWLWRKVKWSPWQPRGVFAMAPFLKLFRALTCTIVPSFMLLWKSEHITTNVAHITWTI